MTSGPLSGKVALVTGSSGGIGRETALGLARMGATVFLHGRDPDRCAYVLDELREISGLEHADLLKADLSSLAEVRKLADELLKKSARLDILVLNAGVSPPGPELTPDGFEETFAVNHLSPFLLTHLLIERLLASMPARVVVVSSSLHKRATLDLDNLQAEKGFRGNMGTYGHTKLMNLLFALALARRLEGTKVTVNAVHPGIAATDLARDVVGYRRWMLDNVFRHLMQKPAKAAAGPIFLASDPEVAETHGAYFLKKKRGAPAANALSVEDQERLWKRSAELAGVDPDALDAVKVR